MEEKDMAKQIRARMKGDDYQIRFFWFKAADMLCSYSKIEKVIFERDDIEVVDDVCVCYKFPGIIVDMKRVQTDFYQVKYQLSRGRHLSIDNLLDPAFFDTKYSFLKRLYDTYLKLNALQTEFRLFLVTNYTWDTHDVALSFLNDDGHFSDSFFRGGSKSKAGKVRMKIYNHLNIDEASGKQFLSKVCFNHGFLSSKNLEEWLSDRLRNANLKPINPMKSHSPYDDLGRKFIDAGKHEFTAFDLRTICEEEGLLADEKEIATRIGIKSFRRCAEDMNIDCAHHLDLTNLFVGRYIINSKDWNGTVSERIGDFFSSDFINSLSQPFDLRLDAHTSITFLAGYLLDSKSGFNVRPIQKDSVRGFQLWDYERHPDSKLLLIEHVERIHDKSNNLIISLSISHDISTDVNVQYKKLGGKMSVVHEIISSNAGINSIQSGAHAHAIADEFQKKVLDLRKQLTPQTIHLFISAPNALTFLIGQRSRGFGPVVIYEYDFEGKRGGKYTEGISIPNRRIE